jgi:hypothetical protein
MENMSAITINPAGSPTVVQQVHGAAAPIVPMQAPLRQTGAPRQDQMPSDGGTETGSNDSSE